MFFHYGSCKSEIADLKRRESDLMHQIQELKALYDYQVGILEIDISQAKEMAVFMDAAREKAQKSLEAELEHKSNLLKDNGFYRKDAMQLIEQVNALSIEIEGLKLENESLKSDIEEWKKQNALLKQEIGSRKCVTDSCEEEIKLLKREIDSLRKEAEVADFFETITSPKPVSKLSRRQK